MIKSSIFLRFALMLALLGPSMACKAGAAIPNLFATATPTATATFTPSPTPDPTATATPLPPGIHLESQADGATLFRDFDNRYELSLPPDWAAIPLSQDDINRTLEQTADQDPEFAQIAEVFKTMGPDVIRLIALNSERRYKRGPYPTIAVITAISDPVAGSMPMAFVTAMIEDNILAGSNDTSWEVQENVHGVEVGIVQGSLKVPTPSGVKADVKAKIIAFQANKKLIMIEFMTPAEFGDEILPALDEIIDTIELIRP